MWLRQLQVSANVKNIACSTPCNGGFCRLSTSCLFFCFGGTRCELSAVLSVECIDIAIIHDVDVVEYTYCNTCTKSTRYVHGVIELYRYTCTGTYFLAVVTATIAR